MLSLHHRPICGQILCKVGNNIAGDLHRRGRPRIARSKLWVDASGMIHKICVEASSLDLCLTQIAGQLMDQCAYHFQVAQFFCTY